MTPSFRRGLAFKVNLSETRFQIKIIYFINLKQFKVSSSETRGLISKLLKLEISYKKYKPIKISLFVLYLGTTQRFLSIQLVTSVYICLYSHWWYCIWKNVLKPTKCKHVFLLVALVPAWIKASPVHYELHSQILCRPS